MIWPYTRHPSAAEVRHQMTLSAFGHDTYASGAAQLPIERMLRAGRDIPLAMEQRLCWEAYLNGRADCRFLYSVIRIEGPFDVELWRRAVAEVERRHECTRTTILIRNGQPVQQIGEPGSFRFECVDLRGHDSSSREEEVQRRIHEELTRTRDVATATNLEALLYRLEDQRWIVLVALDHLVSDFVSMRLLWDELFVLYSAFSRNASSPLDELPLQYADYALWQQAAFSGERAEPHLEYWRKRLRGARPLALKRDYFEGETASFGAGYAHLEIDEKTSLGILAACRTEKILPFVFLLAATKVVLSRWTGQIDISLCSANSGRANPRLAKLMGLFAELVLLRSDLSGNPRFDELLKCMSRPIANDLAQHVVPFHSLIAERLGLSREFSSIMFNCVSLPQPVTREQGARLGDLRIERFESKPLEKSAPFDLVINIAVSQAGIRAFVMWQEAVFRRERMVQLARELSRSFALAAANPTLRINDIADQASKE
jgi:hypothetical protein